MRQGFSLIEIMVGMLIFAIGVLALTASTSFVSMQIQAADVRTERNVAFQQASERLHSVHFDSVNSVSGADALSVGSYAVTWDVESINWSLKQVRLYTVGPGFSGGKRVDSVTDTLVIRIARPVR